VVKNHIFDILSYSAVEAQVMVSGKQALEESQKTGVFNQLDTYGLKVIQTAGNGVSAMWDIRNRDLSRASTGGSALGQGNMATLLQFQKERAAGHVFNLAIGGTPIPEKA
jgi:hypothetical protein